MNQTQHSTEIISALAEGEIEAAEAEGLLNDAQTRERIAGLRQKAGAARDDQSQVLAAGQPSAARRLWPVAGAAVLAFAAGIILGVAGRGWVPAVDGHLLLHVTDGSEAAMYSALEGMEQNLAQGVAVDLVLQRRGVAMVRMNSPVAARLAQLAAQYDELSIYACAGTLERLRAAGASPLLIEAARTDTYAIDRVSHAYKQHWRYERI